MRRAAAFVLGLVIVAPGCGSDESDGSSTKCSQGATRACLGPGACDGAQSCGADGTWGACDCGGSGGAGGGTGGSAVGGSSGIGGGGGAGATNTGGTAGDASPDGAGGGTQWKDDPCPSTTPLIDCSKSCGGPSANCAEATCGFAEHGVKVPKWPVVIRTPSNPGFDSKCAALCPGAGLAFGIGLLQGLVSIQSGKGLRVTVPKPWSVRLFGGVTPNDFCTFDQPPAQCVVFSDNAPEVILQTADPNAPAVNAVLEEVPWPASCP